MRTLRRLVPLSIVLTAAFLLLAPVEAAAFTRYMAERQVSTNAQFPYSLDLSGNRVVWSDYTPPGGGGGIHVFIYDLVTDIQTQVTSGTNTHELPAISGNNVVYREVDGEYSDIRLYDASNGIDRSLGATHGTEPDIDGDHVVWLDGTEATGYRLHFLDLATGTRRWLTSSVGQRQPAISGNKVVYVDGTPTDGDIYVVDVVTGTRTRVTDNGYDQQRPDISGSKLVYRDQQGANYYVWRYDLLSGSSSQLIGNEYPKGAPRISGNRVVYDEGRGTWPEIYLYDLERGAESQLTQQDFEQVEPVVSGNRVAYLDFTDGWRVYVGELLVPSISASGPAVVGYGGTARITGTLTSPGDFALSRRPLRLDFSPDGWVWNTMLNGLSPFDGRYTFTTPVIRDKTYFKVGFPGDAFYLSAESRLFSVTPRVYLTAPYAPSTMYRSKYYWYYGTLKPQHAAGSRTVRIQCYRKESRGYVLRKTVTTTNSNVTGGSRYSARISLGAGSWRFRAYSPTDSRHAATYSGYTYRTVR